MPIAHIAFLVLVVSSFAAFLVTLCATAWYCRDRPALQPKTVRATQPPKPTLVVVRHAH